MFICKQGVFSNATGTKPVVQTIIIVYLYSCSRANYIEFILAF